MRTATEMYAISSAGEEATQEGNELVADKILAHLDKTLEMFAKQGEYSVQIKQDDIKKVIDGELLNKCRFPQTMDIVVLTLRDLGYYAKCEKVDDEWIIAIGWFNPKAANID